MKTSFVSPEVLNAWANKTDINPMIFILIFLDNSSVYGSEPVLIQQVLIVFEALLDNNLKYLINGKFKRPLKDMNFCLI